MSDPAVPEAWRNGPQADLLVYRLLCLAEATLPDYFDDDAIKDYRSRQRAAKRRRGGGDPWLLREWADSPQFGTLALTALPETGAFVLVLSHGAFVAEIALRYELELGELRDARIRHFHGDPDQAVEAAFGLFSELTSLDDSDFDFDESDPGLNEWPALLNGARLLANAGDEGFEDHGADGPPPLRRAERRRLGRMALAVSKRAGPDQAPVLQDREEIWLAETPQALLPMLEEALAVAGQRTPDQRVFLAWIAMLRFQLEEVRYQAERDRSWAAAMLAAYQQRLLQAATGRTVGQTELFELVAILGHAKVSVDPALSDAAMEAGRDQAKAQSQGPAGIEGLRQSLAPLIAQMAEGAASPFELVAALNEGAAVVPGEVRSFVAVELALSPYSVTRDAVPLMLLDPDAQVRRSAAQALEQTAEAMSPETLRRSIALRNWIPEADRAPLDQAIRKARAKGLQPAQWDKPGDIARHASPIDGSGAGSLLFASRSGKTGLLGGLLVKQNFGIRDSWCDPARKAREIRSALSEAGRRVAMPEVEPSFVDRAVQHAIATGVAAGNLPGAAVLAIAECIGASDWKDRLLDVAAETETLFAALPPAQRSAAGVEASMGRLRTWMDNSVLAESWFEDDAEVRSVTDGTRNDTETALKRLLEGPLNRRRAAWGERFLMMALCARAVKPGQPPLLGSGNRQISWPDLVVLAHAVQSGMALRDIPAMRQIAERTLVMARTLKW